jgi:hypothetical protein
VEKILAILTRSDRLALLAYAQSKSMTEAGLKWSELRGVVNSTPEASVAHMSRKISDIRKKLDAAGTPELFWEALGLGANRVAQTLARNLDATVMRPMLTKDGVLIEAGPYPDGAVQVKAAETAARLRGDMKKGESTTVTAGVQGEGFKFIFMVDQK